MNSIKKKISTSLVALSLMTAAVAAPTQNANAGVIIGAFVPGVGSAVVGLLMAGAGFFWGMQSDGLNVGAGALFVLDEKGGTDKITRGLSAKYPELDSFVIAEIAQIVAQKGLSLEANSEGLKEVVLTEGELAQVLEIVEAQDAAMARTLRRDLTAASL